MTRLIGELGHRLLRELEPLLGESVSGVERDAVVAALNGVLGDWLRRTESPLALDMRLRQVGDGQRGGRARPRLGDNDRQWQRHGHDHGGALAQDHGWTPVYVLYNSGLSIARERAAVAERLEALSGLAEIAIVGHSMGGLVARSACHRAELSGLAWRTQPQHHS